MSSNRCDISSCRVRVFRLRFGAGKGLVQANLSGHTLVNAATAKAAEGCRRGFEEMRAQRRTLLGSVAIGRLSYPRSEKSGKRLLLPGASGLDKSDLAGNSASTHCEKVSRASCAIALSQNNLNPNCRPLLLGAEDMREVRINGLVRVQLLLPARPVLLASHGFQASCNQGTAIFRNLSREKLRPSPAARPVSLATFWRPFPC